MTGKQLEYYDTKNVPAKFKKESYPAPFYIAPGTEMVDDGEIDDTLDSIRQAEVMFGYKKDNRNWHADPNWDYYSHYSKSIP